MTYTPVYPEGIDHNAYEAALEQCVFGSGWLFNQSGMDVWYDIDGFVIKVPAGTKVRPDMWENMRRLVEDMYTEEHRGCPFPVARNGFQFISTHKLYIFDELVAFSPDSARHWSMRYGRPERTLEEHIALINTMGLDRITVVAEDLSFLPRCPGLRYIHIVHAKGVDEPLDFSPLYELPNLIYLSVDSGSDGLCRSPRVKLDFQRLPRLKCVALCTNDPFNYHLLPELEHLLLSNDKRHLDLTNISHSPNLKELELLCCSTKTLGGIGQFPLQSVSLSYLRGLEDISALSGCADTLRCLTIDHCGRVKDFSCLHDLVNLECLQLDGSQILPDLSFLHRMPKLRVFTFSMTVANGDLTPCLDIPYVYCSKIKRHYNLKDKELPRDKSAYGFELI